MRRPLLSSGHIVGVVALTFSVSILGRAQSPDSAGTHKRAAATKTTPAHPTTKQRARSATRIPLTKQEAGGEVDLAPSTDTAAVAFVPSDTLAPSVFSTATFDPTAIRKMIDTMGFAHVQQSPFFMTPLGALYASAAAGTSIPSGDIYNGYNPGMNVTMSLGVESMMK